MTPLTEYAEGILRSLPVLARQVSILAGGALRAHFDGTTPKDYDLFYRSERDYKIARSMFRLYALVFPGWTEIEDCPSGTARFVSPEGREFNLIGFHFDQPWAHIEAFDFRCTAMAAWLEDGVPRTAFLDHAILDACKRRLVILNNNGDERTLRRAWKYITVYGYRLPGLTQLESATPSQFDSVVRPRVASLPVRSRGY